MLKRFKAIELQDHEHHHHHEYCEHEHHHHHEHCENEHHHHHEHCEHEHHHHHEHCEHEHQDLDNVSNLQMHFDNKDFEKLLNLLNSEKTAFTDYDIALCRWEKEKSSTALQNLETLTGTYANDTQYAATAFLNLATVYRDNGESNKAKLLFEKTISIAKRIKKSSFERMIAEKEIAKLHSTSLKSKLLNFLK